MRTPKKRAAPMSRFDREIEARRGGVVQAENLSESLKRCSLALLPLDFEERRKVLRWVADVYEIDPGKLPLA